MNKPSKADILLLGKIKKDTEKLLKVYSNLDKATKNFLLEEFTGETELHLLQFERNISEAINELNN